MRKGLPAPLRYQSAARPALPPPAPRSHCSDDSLDDVSTTSSTDDVGLQVRPHPQQASVSAPTDRLRGRKEGSVQVAVRVRPLLPREIAASQRAIVQHPTADSVELLDADKRFTFDHVFPQSATQSGLYDKALQPWLDSFLQGFNVTVIAYGQTGSGKTYTMGNSIPSSEMVTSHLFARSPPAQPESSRSEAVDELKPDDGLIPRFLFQLFERLNKSEKGEHSVSVSFLEIYGEEIHDLLQQSRQTNNNALESLQLREGSGGIYVQGLTEIKVASRDEAMQQMRAGSLRRITGRTEMNEHSSRSHAVYTIKVIRRVNQDGKDNLDQTKLSNNGYQGLQHKNRRSRSNFGSDSGSSSPRGSSSGATVVSKLTFVDLAGSERLKKTLAEGSRMKEGIQINVGLLALGNVINALGGDRRRGAAHLHVPYRSSKLTRLLQDALGGNSRTLFIACVSPASSNASETYNTLQYANRAKNIQNKAVKNIDSRSAEMLQLKAFNSLLRRELVKAFFIRPEKIGSDSTNGIVDSAMADPKVQRLLKKLEEMAASNIGRGDDAGVNNHISVEIQRAFSSLAAQFPGVAHGAFLDAPETPDEFVEGDADETSNDFVHSSGESLGDTSEESDDESAVRMTQFSLHQLSRTLDILTTTLELREVESLELRHRSEFDTKMLELEKTLRRKHIFRTAVETALGKLEVSSTAIDNSKKMKQLVQQLDTISTEIASLEQQRADFESVLAEKMSKCRLNAQRKHEHLLKLRQKKVDISGTTLVSALDVISRSTELQNRFGVEYLSTTADYLIGEEKIMVAYLDDKLGEIGFMSALFSRNEMTSVEAYQLSETIRSVIETSMENEDVNADLSRAIRRRSALLQDIVQGWLANPDTELTEQEYYAANEKQLREFDDAIAELSAVLKARPAKLQSISQMVDSISSLSLAQATMKRLIEMVYSYMRVSIAISNESGSVEVKEPSSHLPRQSLVDADTAQRIEELEKQHDKELADMLELIAATGTAESELNQAQLDRLTHKYTAANEKIKTLEESGERLGAQLKLQEEEASKMKERICELEKALQASESKCESIQIIGQCQELCAELGLSQEAQTSKFGDINEMLKAKYADELESLRAARAAAQERIANAYGTIKLLEVAIDVDDPVDLHMLHAVAGKALPDQEKYLENRLSELKSQLWLRTEARLDRLSRILELMDGMKLEDVTNFRHVPHDQLGELNIAQMQANVSKLQEFKKTSTPSEQDDTALAQFLQALGESHDNILSVKRLQRDEVLLGSLRSEMAKRVAETEQLLSSIRSVSEAMNLSQKEIVSVLQTLGGACEEDSSPANELHQDQMQVMASRISQSGGRTDVSAQWIEQLAQARDRFAEIFDGRANAMTFLFATVHEGEELMKSIPNMAPVQRGVTFQLDTDSTGRDNSESNEPKVSDCDQNALAEGRHLLEELTQRVGISIRGMLYSANDEFMKYGIDTDEQRVSFLLGRQDSEETSATREVLTKYLSCVAGMLDKHTSDSNPFPSPDSSPSTLRADSLLSAFDPLYNEFYAVYSISYGKEQIRRVHDSLAHYELVRQTVESAQKRLQSLSTIMDLYRDITQYREKISQFEASASSKDRLFGSSLRLLEEERFRKAAAKKYPQLIGGLKSEVRKWLQNDGGDYDLNVLGQDMKNMLVEMTNTDTELMHLDLGVVGSSRQSARRGSKSSSATATLSSSSLSNASSSVSSASASASVTSVSSANQHLHQELPGARHVRTRSLSSLASAAAKKRS